MIVVSDASPLIALLSVGRFDVLQKLFGEVLIPPAVYDEVFGCPVAAHLVCPDFLRVENLTSDTPVRFLNLTLHRGESEAIALALEKKSDCVLLDDKFARETADRLGLRVVGTLGLLLLAKKKGFLDAVRPIMIEMMERISFRIAPTIVNRALGLVGEPPL